MCLSKEHQRKTKTLNNFTPWLLSAIFLSSLFKDYRRSWAGKEPGREHKSWKWRVEKSEQWVEKAVRCQGEEDGGRGFGLGTVTVNEYSWMKGKKQGRVWQSKAATEEKNGKLGKVNNSSKMAVLETCLSVGCVFPTLKVFSPWHFWRKTVKIAFDSVLGGVWKFLKEKHKQRPEQRLQCEEEGTLTDIVNTLNNLSMQMLEWLHSLPFVYKPLWKGLAGLPIPLYLGSNGKRQPLCLGEFIKFIGLTCYF